MTNTQEPSTTTIAAQIEALEPCPFCVSDFPIVPSRDKQGFVVICTGCSALGPTRTTEAEANAAWNARPAIVTALRQADLSAARSGVRQVATFHAVPAPATEQCSLCKGYGKIIIAPSTTSLGGQEPCPNCRPGTFVITAAQSSPPSADAAMPTWASATDNQRERLTLLADVELHLQSTRVFITSREKMHPCGVELHDELLAKVSAAIDVIGREKGK